MISILCRMFYRCDNCVFDEVRKINRKILSVCINDQCTMGYVGISIPWEKMSCNKIYN